ncbi:MAG: hypothetical protein AB8B34_09020 [Prochlorococcus sp.]
MFTGDNPPQLLVMKAFNAALTAGILAFSSVALITPTAQAGTSCNTIGSSTYCSGTVNGKSVDISSYVIGDTTYVSGFRGDEAINEECYSLGSSTFCS